jgi:adenylate cyclase
MGGRITVISPEGQRDWVLQDHNSIGRHPSNTIQVLDRIVSKEHCHIDVVAGRYVLRDLGSLNGTYVNGERVNEKPLFTGDEITMGLPASRCSSTTRPRSLHRPTRRRPLRPNPSLPRTAEPRSGLRMGRPGPPSAWGR